MNISTTALALLAALTATSAAASPEPIDNRQDASQAQQDQNGAASAHGYQNPAGPDPDPRMTEQVGDDLHEQGEQRDGIEDDVTREGSERQ